MKIKTTKHLTILSSVLILFLIFTPKVLGQKMKTGPQDFTFFSTADETNQVYSIYIPHEFDEEKEYPLVIFLHGFMSNNRLGLRRVFGLGNIQGPEFNIYDFVPEPGQSDLEVTRYWPEMPNVDYIVAAPLARGSAGYEGIPEQDIYDMIDDIKSRFNIDEDRLYLTGLSMGGGGTIRLAITRPDVWAAIAPTCAGISGENIDMAGNLSNIPVHIFVGTRDRGWESVRDSKAIYEAAGCPVVEYTEYPGIEHNSWEYAYKDGFIFDWFSQFERNLFPESVKLSTKQFKYNNAYWVTIDNLTPGILTSIDAKFTGNNAIEIQTDDLLAFTLKLDGHEMFDPSKKISIRIDGKSFSIKSPDSFSFSKENGTWVNKKFTPGLTAKQKGAEGPLYEAVSSNHIYVYGTADNPSAEELNARRAQAMDAATWALNRGFYQGTVLIFPRVIADNAIRQSDFTFCNLVLFGTKETNSVIAKFEDKLPMHLNDDANDYGLVYIFPINQHYVLINSGLSWWTGPAGSGDSQMSMLGGSRAGSLSKSDDFLLFKGTNDNVIANGNFDNNWSLPSEAINKFKNSAVITIK
jgi:pimeloyl-ACP methyl ester carboxylesterase